VIEGVGQCALAIGFGEECSALPLGLGEQFGLEGLSQCLFGFRLSLTDLADASGFPSAHQFPLAGFRFGADDLCLAFSLGPQDGGLSFCLGADDGGASLRFGALEDSRFQLFLAAAGFGSLHGDSRFGASQLDLLLGDNDLASGLGFGQGASLGSTRSFGLHLSLVTGLAHLRFFLRRGRFPLRPWLQRWQLVAALARAEPVRRARLPLCRPRHRA
jgi:hypothetical protein